jgi:hypothetical protein
LALKRGRLSVCNAQAAFFDDFFGGTFAPFWRALESPIAIACLRFFTLCLPERIWCISVRTSWPAFLLYLRPLDFFFEPELLLRLELDLLLELDFLAAIGFLPLLK